MTSDITTDASPSSAPPECTGDWQYVSTWGKPEIKLRTSVIARLWHKTHGWYQIQAGVPGYKDFEWSPRTSNSKSGGMASDITTGASAALAARGTVLADRGSAALAAAAAQDRRTAAIAAKARAASASQHGQPGTRPAQPPGQWHTISTEEVPAIWLRRGVIARLWSREDGWVQVEAGSDASPRDIDWSPKSSLRLAVV